MVQSRKLLVFAGSPVPGVEVLLCGPVLSGHIQAGGGSCLVPEVSRQALSGRGKAPGDPPPPHQYHTHGLLKSSCSLASQIAYICCLSCRRRVTVPFKTPNFGLKCARPKPIYLHTSCIEPVLTKNCVHFKLPVFDNV